MYARLWWKDARQLWPIWLFLATAAAIGQWLALRFWLSANPHTPGRHATLLVLAIMWASFYAVAAGAAAFAGEREARTLRLLDIMPVERRVVWAGKVSFGLLTTLLLLGVLTGMAAFGAVHGANPAAVNLLTLSDMASLAMIALEALGWGLFWSALLNSALSAAVVALFCTGISWLFLLTELDTAIGAVTAAQRRFGSWWLGIALIVTGISYIVFSRSGTPHRLQVTLRSPIVLVWRGFGRPKKARLHLDSPDAISLVQALEPTVSQVENIDHLALARSRSSRTKWLLEARALAWQTAREGSKTWCLLAIIAIYSFLPVFLNAGSVDMFFPALIAIGIALAAGVSVFGLENRNATYPFLNYHAAHPRLVWLVKLVMWCLGLAAIWVPQVIWATTYSMAGPRLNHVVSIGVLSAPVGFAVAQLCGMAIRRGLTALIAAIILTAALAIPLVAGVFRLIIPPWGPLVVATAFLPVSWAWSCDWLQSRPAPGRWLRLGLLSIGAAFVLSAGYAGYRILSVPNVALITPPASWNKGASAIPGADQNAADLYRFAASIVQNNSAGRSATRPPQSMEVLKLIRQAAARPECRFEDLKRIAKFNGAHAPSLDRPRFDLLAKVVVLDAAECQKSGNLAGAWDDIMLLFQMARQFAEGTAITGVLGAWDIERDALGLAMEWAVAPKQTPERLHAALAAVRAMRGMVQATDAVQAQAHLVEQRLNSPSDQIRADLLSSSDVFEPWWPAWVTLITQPWEITRAKRVNRVLSAAYFQMAIREPFQRLAPFPNEFSPAELAYEHESTPLLDLLANHMLLSCVRANDRNEVGRRALIQVLAIRAWQLSHRGQFPDRLDALVPVELTGLPNDSYSGRPFGYVRSDGQPQPPLRQALWYGLPSWTAVPARSQLVHQSESSWNLTRGYWLLYSVGPDFQDDYGQGTGIVAPNHFNVDLQTKYDLVFAIPPLESDSAQENKPKAR